MKNLRILVVFLLLITLFAGCSAGGYRYVEKGDESYIVLGKTSGGGSTSSSQIAPEVRFSSVAEMKTDIKTGNFTETELAQIERFGTNDQGNIQVLSTEKLYEPKLPVSYELEYISWKGSTYSFAMVSESHNTSAYLRFVNVERFNEELQNQFYRTEWGNGVSQTEIDVERNGTVYHFEDLTGLQNKVIVYSIVDGGKTLYISESYVASYSMTVPDIVRMWGIENGQHFYVSIQLPSSRPTMDELKAFGIREYVETVTE